ncbi:MAG: tryptophan-rich sensory protein [Clostridia bacterium]|nr:tryptophan-rich sensory protein [Clostridia bacterium]
MKIDFKKLIINIAIPLGVGALSALISMGSMESFASLNQPPLSPPAWLFPVVWSILYVLMGISSYLITQSDETASTKTALTVYGVQLFFNFMWSIIFFNFEAYLFAFIWLIALLALVIANAVLFYRIDRRAGLLFIPYILWVIFAGYLNFGIFLLN